MVRQNSQNWPILDLNFKEHKADENQQYRTILVVGIFAEPPGKPSQTVISQMTGMTLKTNPTLHTTRNSDH